MSIKKVSPSGGDLEGAGKIKTNERNIRQNKAKV